MKQRLAAAFPMFRNFSMSFTGSFLFNSTVMPKLAAAPVARRQTNVRTLTASTTTGEIAVDGGGVNGSLNVDFERVSTKSTTIQLDTGVGPQVFRRSHMGSMQGRKFTLTLHVDYTSIDPKLTAFRHFRVLASKGLLNLYSCTCDAVEMVNFLNGTADRRVRLCGFSGWK
nr:hypothetical protein Iba_chr05aCG14460 [Ipomoea batatas]GMD02013.1 hypothetical protein Iba_chr05fCG12590 [Ipomoea batatas]